MRIKFCLIIFTVFSANLQAQTIKEQLMKFGFKDKLMMERIIPNKTDSSAPYVIIDWSKSMFNYQKVSVDEIKRIDKLDDKLALHLFGEKAKNGAYRIVIDELTNKDAYFKAVTSSTFHSSCKNINDNKLRIKCSTDFLNAKFDPLMESQEEVKIDIGIDRSGNLTGYYPVGANNIDKFKGLLNTMQALKYDWYPAEERNTFVHSIFMYRYKKP
ncbi:MAG TPA: hypothetical protein PLZ32_15790 [Saprospiraceae bacterium]|nr:hypothetical protein [Saprospiraceae bacterium]